MSLLGFSFQNETLIPDDLLYLYNVNAKRHLYLYEASLGAREAQKMTEKDKNICFYRLNYLACKRGMKFISFRNETHFGIMQKVPQGRTIRFLRWGRLGQITFFFPLGGKSLLLVADQGKKAIGKGCGCLWCLYGVKIRDLVPLKLSQTLVDHQRPS